MWADFLAFGKVVWSPHTKPWPWGLVRVAKLSHFQEDFQYYGTRMTAAGSFRRTLSRQTTRNKSTFFQSPSDTISISRPSIPFTVDSPCIKSSWENSKSSQYHSIIQRMCIHLLNDSDVQQNKCIRTIFKGPSYAWDGQDNDIQGSQAVFYRCRSLSLNVPTSIVLLHLGTDDNNTIFKGFSKRSLRHFTKLGVQWNVIAEHTEWIRDWTAPRSGVGE